jgi:hypothetical protein
MGNLLGKAAANRRPFLKKFYPAIVKEQGRFC